MTPSSLPHPPRHRIAPLLHSILWMALLSACQDGTAPDLQPWLAQARSQARPLPLPEMTLPAMPIRWRPEPGATDPFGLQLTVRIGHTEAPGHQAARQMVEPAPLPPLRAVAILRRPGASRALLQIGPRLLQVVPGDALPGLHGHVVDIDERSVRLELGGSEVRLDLGSGGAMAIAPPSRAPA